MGMTSFEAEDLVNKLYNSIFDSLVGGGSSSTPAAFIQARNYFTLEPRGRVINPRDFAGAWSPGNPTGSHEAAIAIADLADQSPQFSPMHLPGAVKISDTYEQVLRSTVIAGDDVSTEAKEQYRKAEDFLYSMTPNPDLAGSFIKTESPIYQNYKRNQTAYANAVTAYRASYAAAMGDPKLKAMWPLLGPSLQVPVDQAYHAWRTGGADQVEAMQAILETSGGRQVSRAFSDAQLLFDSYKVSLDEGTVYRRSAMLPSDWWQDGNQNGWPTKTFASSAWASNQSSDYSSASGSGGFGAGLWSFGAGSSSSWSRQHSDAQAESISISYKYALVTIRRPWLKQLLFGLPGWKTDAFPKGSISTGTRNYQNHSAMPLIPQAFYVIKDLTIIGDFSSSEFDHAAHQMSSGASVGWGPFSLSGSYTSNSEQTSYRSSMSSNTIHAPFVQILGWINTIVPACPPV